MPMMVGLWPISGRYARMAWRCSSAAFVLVSADRMGRGVNRVWRIAGRMILAAVIIPPTTTSGFGRAASDGRMNDTGSRAG